MPCHFSRSSVVLYSILISSLRQQARGVCSFTKYYKASVSSIKNRQLLSDLQPLHNYSKLRVPESRLFLPRWHLYAHHYLLMTTIDPCFCRFTIWTLEMVTKKILMILCEGLKHPMRKHACGDTDAHFRPRTNHLRYKIRSATAKNVCQWQISSRFSHS